MALVPSDFPQRLAARGLAVQCFGDWTTCGGSADHRAVVLHHTASGASTRPEDDAAYCHHGTSDAPLYNVLVDRTGVVWLLAREKSNSSGKISSTPLSEAYAGKAGCVSASQRGLSDNTSANGNLFAIAAQNNGTGEPWSSAMVNAINQVAAEACSCLGLHAGHVTQHRVLTARKIDNCGDHCPQDFQPGVAAAMGRGPAPSPEVDMWIVEGILPAGESRDKRTNLQLPLPPDRKSAKLTLYCDAEPSEGHSLWGAQNLNGTNFGAWDNGKQWELWVPGRYPVVSGILPESWAIHLQSYGGTKSPLLVTCSGT